MLLLAQVHPMFIVLLVLIPVIAIIAMNARRMNKKKK